MPSIDVKKARADDGMSALSIALEKGHTEVATLLLSHISYWHMSGDCIRIPYPKIVPKTVYDFPHKPEFLNEDLIPRKR